MTIHENLKIRDRYIDELRAQLAAEKEARENAEKDAKDAHTRAEKNYADSQIYLRALTFSERDIIELRTAKETAEARVKELEAELKKAEKWMDHKIGCSQLMGLPGAAPCTCGLDEFKKGLK